MWIQCKWATTLYIIGRKYNYRFDGREDLLPPPLDEPDADLRCPLENERELPSKPGRALLGERTDLLDLPPVFLASRREERFSILRFCFAACASCSALRLSFLQG